jgi:hypothetical protein
MPEISQIIRSSRKSFSLEVLPDGRLIVRAPQFATNADIQALVVEKACWIARAQARVAVRAAENPPKTFSPGEKFWYLGEQYPLKITSRTYPVLELDGAFILAKKFQSRAKEVFINWYREETRQIVNHLIAAYQIQYGFKINGVRITSARTRWGSCTTKGNLNFTYRLSMAPYSVVEYVVLHELVHLKVPNHSQRFWDEVARINPGYQKSRTWLKEHGHLLTLD